MAYVYVVVADDEKMDSCKIGIADNVERRLSGLQSGNRNKLTCMNSWWMTDRKSARLMERLLHDIAAERRLVSEWFYMDGITACALVDDLIDQMRKIPVREFRGRIFELWEHGDDEFELKVRTHLPTDEETGIIDPAALMWGAADWLDNFGPDARQEFMDRVKTGPLHS